uniref:Uncharacterized protein n=1 Tax=Kalanchoe fedtschenkoi TaxID=63787 RepID=A0A7N0RE21_KALFE
MPSHQSFRQIVCRHWLQGLCMKGDACGFLHQYDKLRMPVCRFFRLYGECREQNCVFKHTTEDIKECNMYKLGFCPNGPDCRYRHEKLPEPPPSAEEVLQKIQQFNYANSNKIFQHHSYSHPQQQDKFQFAQGPNNNNQGSLAKPSPQASQVQVDNGTANQTKRTAIPLPQGASRYFIVKSCNRENLELSALQGVWATHKSNEPKLNEAFDSVENVILIFSVNRTGHFQGCAMMTSKIGGFVGGGNWKFAHGTAPYGRNFSIKWLKLCELSFHKTHHLRNPYNENLPMKITRDCQKLEPSVGEQLTSLLYQEPDSELMAISVTAESKREEEKSKGVSPANSSQKPDIVTFEDSEEEEEKEEESEEEDEGLRGRGAMWPPQIACGARPFMGMSGFGAGDPFGMVSRGYLSYGPRFSGHFCSPALDMMFQGSPQPGMMMGPGRGPFMDQGRPGRNRVGGSPPPPSQNTNWTNKKEQRGRGGDRNERFSYGTDPSKGLETDHSSGGPEEEG